MAQLTYDESNDGECCGQQGCQHQKLEPPNNALANRRQIAALAWLIENYERNKNTEMSKMTS